MQLLAKNKGIIVGALLFLAALWLYNFFSTTESLPAPVGGLSVEPVDNDLITLAQKLSAVTLDQKLFNTAGYRLLSDFSTPLPQEPAGRSNPFDIIGRD